MGRKGYGTAGKRSLDRNPERDRPQAASWQQVAGLQEQTTGPKDRMLVLRNPLHRAQ
jgi:hypothetical protein